MIYFDYAATTSVNEEVLNSFIKCCNVYKANPNSIHKLGKEANDIINEATSQIADILGIKEKEIIYTSGASESNNTAIKGICLKYQNRGRHIITTNLEHSSIYGPISYLQRLGFEVDFVNLDSFGRVDIDHLKSLIREDTILVSICQVNSEVGIINDIDAIGKLLKQYPKCFFHVDMTQALGKIKINLENVDLASCSAHKFFGMKGIGILYKRDNIVIEPLIHGGKSTTIYRSGTPALPLIVSTAKALRLIVENMDDNYKKVLELNDYLKENLKKYENVYINSNNYCSPYILNFSIKNIKPETFVHALEQDNVYISTQTACSSSNTMSRAVFAISNDEDIANHSMRISLSSLSTKEECAMFLKVFDKCYNHLSNLGVQNENNND